MDYLQSGVYGGPSIKEWSDLNQHPESGFYGFNTITELPDDFCKGGKRGKLGGAVQVIDDARVKLIEGLLQNTLRTFLETFWRGNRMIVQPD